MCVCREEVYVELDGELGEMGSALPILRTAADLVAAPRAPASKFLALGLPLSLTLSHSRCLLLALCLRLCDTHMYRSLSSNPSLTLLPSTRTPKHFTPFKNT